MTLNKQDKDWMIAIVEDRVNHLDSSPNTKERLSKLEKDMQTKVSWKQFIWIIGLLVTFMTGILAAIYLQVRSNGELGQQTRVEVSYMRGILTNAEVYED